MSNTNDCHDLSLPAQQGRARADALLAVALAAGRPIADAAREAGVSETTVYRRLRKQKFRDRVSRIRGAMVSEAAGRLAESMSEAAESLAKLLHDEDATIRLRAAVSLLTTGLKVGEASELRERIAELERRAKGVPK